MLTSLPPTDCIQAREAVSARLDGELPELDTLRLDAHLSSCAACRAFAAESTALTGRLRHAVLEPAPAELFVPHRRRVGVPFAAAAATLVVAAATGSSFFLGELVGGRGTSGGLRSSTGLVSSPTDPALLAMLHTARLPRPQTGRVIAL